MAGDPRLYTIRNSCVMPTLVQGVFTGYRRVDFTTLLRHARKEGTRVDISIKPFGLSIRHGGLNDVYIPNDRGKADELVGQLVLAHPVIKKAQKSISRILSAVNTISIRYCHHSFKIRAFIGTEIIGMDQIAFMSSTAGITNICISASGLLEVNKKKIGIYSFNMF